MITLGVIGVVAAMTLPPVITNYQKKQTVTQFKKAYSELYNVIKMSEVKYGTMDTWDLSNFANARERSAYFMDNYLAPNLKMLKKCTPTTSECWADGVKTIDGMENIAALQNDKNAHISFITSSGYSLYYWLHGTGDGGWFFVDVNGLKKPNIVGKDIFPFTMTWGNNVCPMAGKLYCSKSGLYPFGMEIKNITFTREDLKTGGVFTQEQDYAIRMSNCAKGTSMAYAGYFCGGLIMMDSWEIRDDYPW